MFERWTCLYQSAREAVPENNMMYGVPSFTFILPSTFCVTKSNFVPNLFFDLLFLGPL